jgi:hypothetical protein
LFPGRGNPDKVKGHGCHGLPKKLKKFWKNNKKGKDEKNVGGLLPVIQRTSRISSYADFTFPLNKTEDGEENKFFFVSRGWWSAGRVNVFQKGVGSLRGDHDDGLVLGGAVKGDGEVKVHVDISYEDDRYLDYVKVCKIAVNTGKDGEEGKVSTGVGIFVSPSPPSSPFNENCMLMVDVYVLLDTRRPPPTTPPRAPTTVRCDHRVPRNLFQVLLR